MADQPKPKKHSFLNSLTFKVGFLATLLMIVVLVVFSAVFIVSERQKTKENILKNGKTFSTFSAQSIYDNYAAFYTHPQPEDFDNFKSRVQATLDFNRDIKQVSLLGLRGRVLFDTAEFTEGKYKGPARIIDDQDTISALSKETMTARDVTVKGEPFTEIVVPLGEPGQSHILSMRYLLSYESLAQSTREIYLRATIVALILTAFSVAVAILLSTRLTRPIVRLTRVAQQIQGGNLDARVQERSNDEIGLLGAAFNDMTTNLVKSRAQLAASIRSLPFGFAVIDPQDRIVFSNQVLGKLFDWEVPIDPEASHQFLQTVDANFKTALGILDDIHLAQTKRQAVERNVELGPHFYRFFFMPILADTVQEATALGTVMVVEDTTNAKAQERSRDEFFSIASHELRTPLTAIRGNTDMILNYYQEQLKDPSLQEMITDIHDGSVRLISIVNDFLDISRLEQRRLEFKNVPFDIIALVEETLHEYNVTGSRKKLSLELVPPTGAVPQVLADRDRTRQILINLIGNGIKFTKEGGIKIQLEPKEKTMEITVTDTGRGIPDKYLHLLFRKFQQATASILTRDDTKGTGLGLYISRLLAVGMHGDLALKWTKEGEGTAFTLTLPLAPPAPADAKKPPPPPPPL